MSDPVTSFLTEENQDLGKILLNKTEYQIYLNQIMANNGITPESPSGGGTTPTGPVITSAAWGWGDNNKDQLGIGHSTGDQNIPTQVINTGLGSGFGTNSYIPGIDKIAVNNDNFNKFTLIIDTAGKMWGCGNSNSNLWSGIKSIPLMVHPGPWASVNTNRIGGYAIYGIKSDGTLWTADSFTNGSSGFYQYGIANDWSKISLGSNHKLAIKTDGSLWAWGENDFGQVGNNYLEVAWDDSIVGISSPIQIGTDTNWSKIACSYEFSIAIKNDGTLWSWGQNLSGQLGINSTIHKSSPTQVGIGTDWNFISVGASSAAAIKINGSLWLWGLNYYGTLGNNQSYVTYKSSPIQTIAGGNNWSKIAFGTTHVLAIKTNGTLWSWGVNSSGELGDGTTVSKSSPIQVGTDTNWLDIVGGDDFTIGVKSV